MTDVLGENQTTTGWTVDDSTFGARLALVRHRMGWNVKEAAREVGVPAASWRSWEEGAQPRNVVEIAGVIAQRTGCDYGWLLAGRRLTTYAGTRGGTNQRSGNRTLRLRRRSSQMNAKPRVLIRHPVGRPEAGNAASSPTGSPSQRRPGLVSHRSRD